MKLLAQLLIFLYITGSQCNGDTTACMKNLTYANYRMFHIEYKVSELNAESYHLKSDISKLKAEKLRLVQQYKHSLSSTEEKLKLSELLNAALIRNISTISNQLEASSTQLEKLKEEYQNATPQHYNESSLSTEEKLKLSELIISKLSRNISTITSQLETSTTALQQLKHDHNITTHHLQDHKQGLLTSEEKLKLSELIILELTTNISTINSQLENSRTELQQLKRQHDNTIQQLQHYMQRLSFSEDMLKLAELHKSKLTINNTKITSQLEATLSELQQLKQEQNNGIQHLQEKIKKWERAAECFQSMLH